MQGAVQIEGCEMEGYDFKFILISRRSRERAGKCCTIIRPTTRSSVHHLVLEGMRYQRRGINEYGDVANFVETEEIVLFEREGDSHAASFVQTRGSSK
jgi:hypothetical protein